MNYIPLTAHIKAISDAQHVDMGIARDMLLADIDRRSPEYPIESEHAPSSIDYEALCSEYDAMTHDDKVAANRDLRLFIHAHLQEIAAFGTRYDDLEAWVSRVYAQER